MSIKRIAVAAAVLALTACSAPGPASSHDHAAAAAAGQATAAAAAAAASSSAACSSSGGTWTGVSCDTPSPAPDTGTSDGSPFTCSTVVDSHDSTSPFKVVQDGGSLTAQEAIAYLEALVIADTDNLSAGNANSTAAAILDGARSDLINHHLGKLAHDAQQFANDEQDYNPKGPVDMSRWPAVQSDIFTLGKDCPQALAEAYRINRGGAS